MFRRTCQDGQRWVKSSGLAPPELGILSGFVRYELCESVEKGVEVSVRLPEPVVAFLVRPNPAVMAVVRNGNEPVSVATWYLFLDGSILVNMLETRKRLKYVRNQPHVSLTVLGDGDWYRHVSLQGKVRQIIQDEDYEDADRLSRHYIGVPHTPRLGARVSLWIDISQWHAWRVEVD